MTTTRLQFGMRGNTASSRQHAPRLKSVLLSSGDALTDRLLTTATAGNRKGNTGGFQLPSIASSTGKFTDAFEPLIGCAEAAQLLGNIHVKTLQRYARTGALPGYRVAGHWYFRASELDAWLNSRINSCCHPCRSNQEAK